MRNASFKILFKINFDTFYYTLIYKSIVVKNWNYKNNKEKTLLYIVSESTIYKYIRIESCYFNICCLHTTKYMLTWKHNHVLKRKWQGMEHLSSLQTTVESCQTHGPFLRKGLWVSSPRSLCFVPRDWLSCLDPLCLNLNVNRKMEATEEETQGHRAPKRLEIELWSPEEIR